MEIIVWTLMLLGLIYIFFQIKRLSFINKLKKPFDYLVAFSFILPFIILSIFYLWAVAIYLAHLLIIYFITNIIERIRYKKIKHYNATNIVAISVTTFIMCIAYFVLTLHTFEVKYEVKNLKSDSSLRVALIADVHLSTILDGKDFEEKLHVIEEEDPDILVITGDFVDDKTKYDDVVYASQALGNFSSKYGVFYVQGNHDKGYRKSSYRGFSIDDLYSEFKKNNVKVLEDELYYINDDYVLAGRKDRSCKDRLDAYDLVNEVDDDKYIIMLDHQPNDYKNELCSDLVLSGHTHGGNLFPINFLVTLANDQTYGIKRIENTDFIVTSGLSQWSIPFNTCIYNEYVLIDINGNM